MIFCKFVPKKGIFFARKWAKRPPGAHWDPQDNKTFSELPGYEKPILEKKIFEISPIETKLTDPYQSYGRYLEIGPEMGEIGILKIVPGQIPLAEPQTKL